MARQSRLFGLTAPRPEVIINSAASLPDFDNTIETPMTADLIDRIDIDAFNSLSPETAAP
jgi:hypothetical protein